MQKELLPVRTPPRLGTARVHPPAHPPQSGGPALPCGWVGEEASPAPRHGKKRPCRIVRRGPFLPFIALLMCFVSAGGNAAAPGQTPAHPCPRTALDGSPTQPAQPASRMGKLRQEHPTPLAEAPRTPAGQRRHPLGKDGERGQGVPESVVPPSPWAWHAPPAPSCLARLRTCYQLGFDSWASQRVIALGPAAGRKRRHRHLQPHPTAGWLEGPVWEV